MRGSLRAAPGDVVPMANLGVHEIKGLRQAIKAVGANFLFMPIYSPDFNPNE
ncbi:hypothetical protein D7X30_38810 [Corallococcus sp. AB011P]|uniref:transposase n=1 Tax=Corallococcus sp. AB011P TaxID=2316735 RepID=UPI000EA11DAD|nr:hypothetical protein D7X30_38810 [Corallococcus sp. AB011P]